MRLFLKKKGLGILGIVVLAILFVGGQSMFGTTQYNQQESLNTTRLPDALNQKEIVIEPGDTFATVMESQGVPYEDTEGILVASKDIYDLTKIQVGKIIHLFFAEEALAAVDYDLNDEMKVVVEKKEVGFEAREEPIVYDITQVVAQGTITSSLFADGAEAGLSDVTMLELADIFGWDIDFSTDIRKNDSFKLVYEKRFLNGEEASPGKILAARFENQGEAYEAYYYQSTDGKEGYYNTRGESLARQFLKSPINFGYVSSGFSYSRVNPVTKQVTPHRAIDYAAPQGTPVVAIADGEVTLAGSKGGLGITIEVEHGQYKSQYAHLSKIKSDVKRGATVYQGDVIGYVGSTGISTGPHLQYAFFKDGAPINPLTAELPLGEPLGGSEQDRFVDATRELRQQINN